MKADERMKDVKINTEFIKLDQFLKYEGIVSTGGEAKIIISQGDIKVNGKTEYERGKKLRVKDIVEYNNMEYQIV